MRVTDNLKNKLIEPAKQAYMLAAISLVVACVALLMATRKGK
jgi:hypothetical protein